MGRVESSRSRRLRGKGAFSADDAFHDFLDSVGRGDTDPMHVAFVARNFLLDEGVSQARRASYEAEGAAAGHVDFSAWKAVHGDYLRAQVQLPGEPSGPSRSINLGEPETVPETFRELGDRQPYGGADDSLHLVRVVAISGLCRVAVTHSKDDVDVVKHLMERALSGDTDARTEVDNLLAGFAVRADLRPVFAAFRADIDDLVHDDPAHDEPDWANALRDRLGLVHLSPRPGGEEPILLLRYPLKALPTVHSAHARTLLVAPTVLDGAMNHAFVPAPKLSAVGFALDLSGRAEVGQRREVLHPAVRFRAEHIWRVGAITAPVSNEVKTARGLHILQVRDREAQPDYAAETDGDILS